MKEKTEANIQIESPQAMDELLATLTPEIHENLKRAVALGRWPNGNKLSSEQVQQCMQLVILYEAKWLPEDQRTGAPLRNCKGL
ncbi:MAG: DUF1315 family protein [Gammaproteobacteria bacterium]|nr:DUF1315 family protein [Gammaproteobacteria bacterium]MCY4356163.1 DUF1315 family protein [Gammaproteobacteria bacterium]